MYTNIVVIVIININILLYISVSQTLSLAACGSIYANKIVPVRHNAHYSAFVYSACTESEREYGILLNLCTFNYLGYVVQQSNINAVLHCLKHNDGKLYVMYMYLSQWIVTVMVIVTGLHV